MVDQLWAYLLDGVESVLDDGSCTFLFPDQQLRLSMGLVCEQQIRVRVDDESHQLPAGLALWSLAEGGGLFFTEISDLCTGKAQQFAAYVAFAAKLAKEIQTRFELR